MSRLVPRTTIQTGTGKLGSFENTPIVVDSTMYVTQTRHSAVAWGLRTAVMCAEVLWWRCHRRIIADVLVSLGARVIHIMDDTTAPAHRLTAPGRLLGGVVTYVPKVSSA